MNKIIFNEVDVKHFQSLIKAKVNFSDFSESLVKVTGFNNAESTASSNGAGKSSIFEAIVWALYQTTSSGNKEISNNLTEGTASVSLDFSINNNRYIIHRKPTKVVLLKVEDNIEEDISATNRSETNKKIIKMIGIEKNLFLNTIFISQNSQSLMFSHLSPSSRKERIEELVELDNQMYELNARVSDRLKSAMKQVDLDKIDSYESKARKEVLIDNISQIKRQTSDLETKILALKNVVKEDFTEKEDKVRQKKQEQEKKLNSLINEIQDLVDPLNKNIRESEDENLSLNTIIKRIELQIKELQDSSICPTCKRPFEETDSHSFDNMKKELEAELEINKIKRRKNGIKQQTFIEQKDKLTEIFKIKSKDIEFLIKQYQEELDKIEKRKQNNTNDSTALQAKQEVLNSQLVDKNKELSEVSKKHRISVKTLEDSEQKLEVLEDLKKRLLVEFRSYILSKILTQFNEILSQMSEQIFDNKKIQIIFNKSKIEIEIQSSKFSQSYESLSGGEKRKVDLVLLLAQQELLSQVTDSSSNILILDEVLENMDELAINSSLNLIESRKHQDSSVFIISHTDYQMLDFDYTINVIKESDGSHIEVLQS